LLREGRVPYLSTAQHPINMLNPGQSSGRGGMSFVKDGQVLFAFDIVDLPIRAAVIAMKAFDLNLEVTKLWADGQKTDMVCILNQKVCSGDLYSQREMQGNISFAFFAGKEPPNDYFSRQIPPAAADGLKMVMRTSNAKMRLAVKKLLENSITPDPLKLLYPEGEDADRRTLYFAVAHDVYVKKNPRLAVEFSVEHCVDKDPTNSVETREISVPREAP
jgi:hypothetical protein